MSPDEYRVFTRDPLNRRLNRDLLDSFEKAAPTEVRCSPPPVLVSPDLIFVPLGKIHGPNL